MSEQTKTKTVVGWVLSGLIGAMLTFSAAMKFLAPEPLVEQFVDNLGFQRSTIVPLGIVELFCVVVFLVPRTAAYGAILLTGYLGGAIASHVRIQDAFIMPAVLAVAVWGALYLRNARLRTFAALT